MLTLQKIAVTGGLASGKSLFCNILQELGAYVISADQIVHQLLSLNQAQNEPHLQKIISLLGNEIIINEKIDRKKVAEIVFQSPKLLKGLEEILHPLVHVEIQRQYDLENKKENKDKKNSLFVVEVPLLFETGDASWYDVKITIQCREEIALSRFCEKTGYTEEDYKNRMSRQFTSKQKGERADIEIINNGTKDALRKVAVDLYHQLNDCSNDLNNHSKKH